MPSTRGSVTLTSAKAAYGNGETVSLELRNDSQKSVYLTPSTCNGLGFEGNVHQRTGDRFDAIVTQNNQAACALLPDIEIKPGARRTLQWNGTAFQGPFRMFGTQ
ncbi:MAG: hypothetical protein Q7R47_03625, partial [Candidatus Diapherotrites archaeon]|nr:hypothetical protein [Candidatus Diapherotrites archaeon]